jgi:hypothetical protein
MKKMNFKNILFSAALAAGAMSLASCSLEEENPGGFTMEISIRYIHMFLALLPSVSR